MARLTLQAWEYPSEDWPHTIFERVALMKTKKCKGCADNRPIEEFKEDRRSADNLSVLCESCRGQQNHSAESVDSRLYEQYDRCCAVCKSEVFRTQLLVDRDPFSSKITGLLCRDCARILRYSSRRPKLLRAAIAYLDPPKLENKQDTPEDLAKTGIIHRSSPPLPANRRPRY